MQRSIDLVVAALLLGLYVSDAPIASCTAVSRDRHRKNSVLAKKAAHPLPRLWEPWLLPRIFDGDRHGLASDNIGLSEIEI
jgi:hypothetical protein